MLLCPNPRNSETCYNEVKSIEFFFHRFTAIVAMDMKFEKIDLNPCVTSEGNPQPNMFGGTAGCTPTTVVRSSLHNT